MIAKKTDTPPPHASAASFIPKGSGSKRSMKRSSETTIARGTMHKMARKTVKTGPLAWRKPSTPTIISAAPAPATTDSKMGRGFFFGLGTDQTWAVRGASVGYCAVRGPGIVGPLRTKDSN
jgi:hypothetical protein